MPKLIGDVALESRGVRLPPNVWRRIEFVSEGKPAAWIRKQLEAAVERVPDMPNQHENVQDTVEFE
jgi:hypothetical protein